MSSHRVIHLHPDHPAKPALGAPCNGCGVCCAAEPCPLGIVVSRRRSGPCAALHWQGSEHRYACLALVAPGRIWPWLPKAGQTVAARLVHRWIAAGQGCDATLAIEPVTQDPANSPAGASDRS